METLANLNRTGRIGKASALVGSLLNIRPILSFADGLIVPVEKFRGSSAKANLRLLELLGAAMADKPCSVALVHADVPEEARRLEELLPQYLRPAGGLHLDDRPDRRRTRRPRNDWDHGGAQTLVRIVAGRLADDD